MSNEENITVDTPAADIAEEEDILAAAEAMSRGAKGDKDSKKKLRHAEAELAEANKKIESLTAELAELNNKYLLLAAEYDNFRRRTARERENTYADAFETALSAFLPVVDNLERAAQYSDGESVAKGVALVLKSVEETLARLGVTEIEALGKEFDPQYHNAVMHVDDPEVGESVVVEVLQKGYIKGERVLRYAMVKVAN
ncbi:MAG: nucleotide exchange factor GrpE [Clostridia bacterium]|nr:nucleotide exchange factor GrpE [Clostridia bacterium]